MTTSMEELNQRTITIKREAIPDLTITDVRKDWNDKSNFFLVSFLFDEMLLVEQECDEEGNPKYGFGSDGKYRASKLEGDKILVMDEKAGWRVHQIATIEWANILADRELLK